MKTLFLIRHAKSSWKTLNISDKDRPLNKRGMKDAPEMAQRLLEKGFTIDTIICSSANRTLSTAQLFAKVFHLKQEQMEIKPELYDSEAKVYYRLISQIENTKKSVAIIGHNPEISDFVNSLNSVTIDNIPTCGIVAIEIEGEDWSQFESASKSFLFFDFPKLV